MLSFINHQYDKIKQYRVNNLHFHNCYIGHILVLTWVSSFCMCLLGIFVHFSIEILIFILKFVKTLYILTSYLANSKHFLILVYLFLNHITVLKQLYLYFKISTSRMTLTFLFQNLLISSNRKKLQNVEVTLNEKWLMNN